MIPTAKRPHEQRLRSYELLDPDERGPRDLAAFRDLQWPKPTATARRAPGTLHATGARKTMHVPLAGRDSRPGGRRIIMPDAASPRPLRIGGEYAFFSWTASALQASSFRSDVTVFRLNARPRPKTGSDPASDPAFRRTRRNAYTQSRRLITRGSQVQILPPLLRRPRKAGPFCSRHPAEVASLVLGRGK
jgi:hypothetical protein